MFKDRCIDKITLYVSNYARSVDFYKNQLGLEPAWESEEYLNAGFRTGSGLIILQEHGERVQAGGFVLYFTTLTIEADRERLLQTGITCSEVRNFGEFQMVDFSDPDGARLGLMQPAETYIPELEGYLGYELRLPAGHPV